MRPQLASVVSERRCRAAFLAAGSSAVNTSDRFRSVSPYMYDQTLQRARRTRAVITKYTLRHCSATVLLTLEPRAGSAAIPIGLTITTSHVPKVICSIRFATAVSSLRRGELLVHHCPGDIMPHRTVGFPASADAVVCRCPIGSLVQSVFRNENDNGGGSRGPAV